MYKDGNNLAIAAREEWLARMTELAEMATWTGLISEKITLISD